MGLKKQITDDLATAMKSKDKKTTEVLRMLLSEIKYAQAAVDMRQELGETEVLKAVEGYNKRLVKSLDEFPEGERKEQVRAEIAIIEKYLPRKATAAEITAAVDAVLNATADRQFGPLMKQVMSRLGSGADGRAVSEILRSKLAQL